MKQDKAKKEAVKEKPKVKPTAVQDKKTDKNTRVSVGDSFKKPYVAQRWAGGMWKWNWYIICFKASLL